MKIIKVNLKKRSYDIIVGANTIRLLGKLLRKLSIGNFAYVITNPYIKNKYGNLLQSALKKYGFGIKFKTIPDSEKSKSIETAYSLIKDIVAYDKHKQAFIIAFGGGVVGDLAGFAASIYKRGIAYIQVPTTLLAQVDSAIGGKTGVDLPEGKNLIGAFYQPRLVLSDTEILRSLDLRQIRNGLAEVIKYAIIKDRQLFSYLEEKYRDIINCKPAALEFITWRCSRIKAKITEEDELETKGVRTILNFGHTIGHAIETAGNYELYNHGEAIALGMLAASDISRRLKHISNTTAQRIERLINAVGLPVKIKNLSGRSIIKAHYRDKKFKAGGNKFVLIRGIGKTVIAEDVPIGVIKASLNCLLRVP